MSSTAPTFAKLSEENYHPWSKNMQAKLITKGLWEAITNPSAEGNDSKSLKATAEIMLHVEDSQQHYIDFDRTAAKNWSALKDAFAKVTEARTYQLKQQLAAFKLGRQETLQQYYGRFANLQQQLKDAGKELDDEDERLALLSGLPADYNTVVEILHGTSNTATVKARLLVTEAKLGKGGSSGQPGGGSSSKESGAYSARGNAKYCKICKRPGHTTQECRRGKCNHCNKPGHKEEDCYTKYPDKRPSKASGLPAVAFQAIAREPTATCAAAGAARASGAAMAIDSGATHHMTPDKTLLESYGTSKDLPQSITVSNGSSIGVDGSGSVELLSTAGGAARRVTLKDTLHAPGLDRTLISVQAITFNGGSVLFHSQNKCDVFDKQDNLTLEARTSGRGQLYNVINTTMRDKATALVASSEATAELWHRRMGHLSYPGLAKLTKIVDGINMDAAAFNNITGSQDKCDSCQLANQPRAPRPTSCNKETELLRRLHVDTSGRFPVETLGGAEYYVTITDEASRFKAVILIDCKSDAAEALKGVIKQWQLITSKKVVYLRCDNGGEYINNNLQDFLEAQGTTLEPTAAYSPESNGISERSNRTIMERTRAMLLEAGLPQEFWGEAVTAAVQLLNVSPSSHSDKTPWELFYGRRPDVSRVKAFGSQCYMHIPKEKRNKLDNRAAAGVLLGTNIRAKTYRVYSDGRVTTHRDVVVNENERGWKNMDEELPARQPAAAAPPLESSDEAPVDEHLDTFSDDEEPQELQQEPQQELQQEPQQERTNTAPRYNLRSAAPAAAHLAAAEPTSMQEAMDGPSARSGRQQWTRRWKRCSPTKPSLSSRNLQTPRSCQSSGCPRSSTTPTAASSATRRASWQADIGRFRARTMTTSMHLWGDWQRCERCWPWPQRATLSFTASTFPTPS